MLSHCFLRAACLPISPWRLRRDHTRLFTPDRQCYGMCLAEGVICDYNKCPNKIEVRALTFESNLCWLTVIMEHGAAW
jgi:hypothetical protein